MAGILWPDFPNLRFHSNEEAEMPKYEPMFVRHSEGTIKEIKDADSKITKFTNPERQPVWENWLRERLLEGWLLVSEYTLNTSLSVHATLVRQIKE
jgi:hypothetical protein